VKTPWKNGDYDIRLFLNTLTKTYFGNKNIIIIIIIIIEPHIFKVAQVESKD